MRHLSSLSTTLIFAFTTFLLLPSTLLNAQTNFVKYTGNPVLPLGSPGEWDDTEASHAHVSYDGATYQMWYSGAPQVNTYRIGYATSPDGLNWTKDAANPVLNVGGAGTFDSISLWLPTVLFDGTQYEMWYSGGITGVGIGYATAPDAVTWTRESSDPALGRGSAGQWDGEFAFLPIVLRSDTFYHMWYTGRSARGLWQTGYATSSDGINWSKYQQNPVLPVGDAGSWDASAAAASSIIFENGQYHMWYHGEMNSDLTGVAIGYATSTDGINWTKHPDNPILQAGPDNWDAKNVWFPRVIKEGHRYRMWYTGTFPGTTIDRLGYAEDFSDAAHVDSIRVNVETVLAGAETVSVNAYVANPHNENLTARALILSGNSVISEVVELIDAGNGRWYGQWAVPVDAHNYSVGVELNNLSASYVHNSLDWGVFDEFRSISPSHSFTQIDSIDDGEDGEANDLIVTGGGTLLLANGPDGLRAYAFDGAAFANVAHIHDGGSAMSVAVASDGTIFLANGDDGLRAYRYDGTTFTATAHVDDGGSAVDVAVSSGGTVFLANNGDGLRAYSYDGVSFTSTAHIDTDGSENTVAVGTDGTIFLYNGRQGLRAYSYDGNSFTNTAHTALDSPWLLTYGVTVAPDGTVFIANGYSGLFAYTYDGSSFDLKANDSISNSGEASDVSVDSSGTVFLAIKDGWLGGSSSLWAYEYDGDSLNPTASIATSSALGVATGADGTVFLANGSDGLFAYRYSPNMPTSIADTPSAFPTEYALLQNYPNPFNPTTTIAFSLPQSSFVTVKVYNLLGKEVTTVLAAHKPAGQHSVIFDASALASGLYYYTLTAGDFTQSRKMLLLR